MKLSLLLLLVLLTKSSSASYNGLSDELRFIHQEMGALRAENQRQNKEIASLQETVQSQNKTINQHEATIKELIISGDHKTIKNDHEAAPSAAMSRLGRPARLLPSFVLRGKKRNETEEDSRNLFYGPPTSCSDLVRLGYTLNGYYIVKKFMMNYEKLKNVSILDPVYCNFKQEGNFDQSLVEKSVMPYAFSSPLMQNHAFHAQMHSMEVDVYFSFSAHGSKKDRSGVLTFDQPLHNNGNAFDGKTGYFKAPKIGIYHFLYEIIDFGLSIIGNETNVDIYMNDGLVANSLSSISQDLRNMSLQVTLRLNAGDSVCFKTKTRKNIRNNASNQLPTEPISFMENVRGFLLKATFI